ncbi:MAG: NAD-dependent epimerase/dehydratase family protein [Pseudomonadales bacterium]
MTSRVLLTGAGGFIGGHLLQALNAAGFEVRALSRHNVPAAAESLQWPTAAAPTNAQLDDYCAGVAHCFHVAGIAHDAARGDSSGGAKLRSFNVDRSVRLYQAAIRNGCESFVWLSSSKVLGDQSSAPLPVQAPYAPVGGYAQSKVEAEQALLAVAVPETRLLILRPPLVYGPGVGANFRRLLGAALGRWPLPLASARAQRSFVGVNNLCDALLAATQAPPGIYHVADAQPASVAQLLTDIARCADRRLRLLPFPPALARWLLAVLGQSGTYERLFTSFLLETRDSEQRLNWSPVRTRDVQLADTVSWFLQQR